MPSLRERMHFTSIGSRSGSGYTSKVDYVKEQEGT
jgi:hypothetical protein